MTAPELSRRVAAADIGGEPRDYEIIASTAERSALARRFGLQALPSLAGTATVRRASARNGSGPVIRVDLAFEARLVQTCVVTLEPLPAQLAETGLIIEYRIAGDSSEPSPGSAAVVDLPPCGAEPPEPLEGEMVDLGEVMAQHLGAALDPWPACARRNIAGAGG